MTRKFLTILLLFSFLLPGLLLAQNQILRADGSLQPLNDTDREAIKITKLDLLQKDHNQSKSKNFPFHQILGTADTLSYTNLGSWGTNFGMFGQDVMMQWFVAPADMNIVAVRANVTDNEWDEVLVKIE